MVFDIIYILGGAKKLEIFLNKINQASTSKWSIEFKLSLEEYGLFYKDDSEENYVGLFLVELKNLKIINWYQKNWELKSTKTLKNQWLNDAFIKSYISYAGIYSIDVNFEKIAVLISILTERAKFKCNKITLQYLVRFSQSIIPQELVDILKLEDKYIFSDPQLIIYTIWTIDIFLVVKMLYIFTQIMNKNELDDFWKLINLEENISLETKDELESQYKIFYFTRNIWEKITFNRENGEVFVWKRRVGNISISTQEYHLFSILYDRIGEYLTYEEIAKEIEERTWSINIKKDDKVNVWSFCSNLKDNLDNRIKSLIETQRGRYMLKKSIE